MRWLTLLNSLDYITVGVKKSIVAVCTDISEKMLDAYADEALLTTPIVFRAQWDVLKNNPCAMREIEKLKPKIAKAFINAGVSKDLVLKYVKVSAEAV
ncbi:hypothetical protein AGMMS49975_19420 [Clostridia bacterium]|nr:hypothetical protein AGMMS49975_19420 [Clostridia bacterium]